VTGSKKFLLVLYDIFGLPSPRNAQKTRLKQIEKKIGFTFLVDCFAKTFRHVLFWSVVELVENLTPMTCNFGISFDMDLVISA
jgi:hypothetical protein